MKNNLGKLVVYLLRGDYSVCEISMSRSLLQGYLSSMGGGARVVGVMRLINISARNHGKNVSEGLNFGGRMPARITGQRGAIESQRVQQ